MCGQQLQEGQHRKEIEKLKPERSFISLYTSVIQTIKWYENVIPPETRTGCLFLSLLHYIELKAPDLNLKTKNMI